MISGPDENNKQLVHVMYIKDIQKYTKLHICPKCGYNPPATNHNSYHKNRFEEYVKNVKRKFQHQFV
jgi:hypothetical protein